MSKNKLDAQSIQKLEKIHVISNIAGLTLSFHSAASLIFAPITNKLIYWRIVITSYRQGVLSIMPNLSEIGGNTWGNWNVFFRLNRATNRNGSCHFKFFFQIPYLGLSPVCQKWNGEFWSDYSNWNNYVDHLQRWSKIFQSEETEMGLFILIKFYSDWNFHNFIFGIMESTQVHP